MGWRCCLGHLCCAWVFCCLGGPANAQPEVIASDLYHDAMLAIAEGRLNDAQTKLAKLVAKEPRHAGAWLDLAMLYCSAGNADEAEKLFAEIEYQFSPPPPIIEVISKQRQLGCAGPQAAYRGSVRLGKGVESNVNQGALNPNISIGSGTQQVQLVLLPEYQAQSDQLTHFSADVGHDFSFNGLTGLLQFQSRIYEHLSAYSTSSVFVSLAHPWQYDRWFLQATGTVGWVTLDQNMYSRQQQLQLELQTPIGLLEHWRWGLSGIWSNVSYPRLTGFDAQWHELRTALSYKNGRAWWQMTVGIMDDQQIGQRPGGNRVGSAVALQGQFDFGSPVLLEAGWQLQKWQGDARYFPGVIDTSRSQQTAALRFAAVLPLNKQQSLTLEYKDIRNTENISIFEYRNQVLQLSWQWYPLVNR